MKQTNLALFVLLFFIAVFCPSCEECDGVKEPVAEIYISDSSNSNVNYNEVYAIVNGKAKESFNYENSIPISLANDTTFFVLKGNNLSDTLAFSYAKNIDFESRQCGYTYILENFKVLPATTFSNVEFYITENTFFLGTNSYTIEATK